jgi:hypothetical protein
LKSGGVSIGAAAERNQLAFDYLRAVAAGAGRGAGRGGQYRVLRLMGRLLPVSRAMLFTGVDRDLMAHEPSLLPRS